MKWKSILLVALLGGSAGAHTAVTGVIPAAHATVTQASQVTLQFSEPINLTFSKVKVYPLPTSGDRLTVNRAAAALAKAVLKERGDEGARADTAPRLRDRASRLVLPLKTQLKPGTYVIMWQLLSEDGHPVTGQSVFYLK